MAINSKIQIGITYFIRLILVIAIIFEIINRRWALLFTTSIILILTYLPYFFERRFKIMLPIELELLIILFIYGSLFLGEIRDYYTRYWWWDAFLHTGSGVALGLIGFIILLALYSGDKLKAKPIWIAIFSFCFAVALGAVWEIFEFGMDQVFGMNMQKSGLIDTMWDLIVDSIGALLISIAGYFYIKNKKVFFITSFLEKFKAENPRIFKN